VYAPVGRYEDILLLIARREGRLQDRVLPSKPRLLHWIFEPFCHLVGLFCAWWAMLAPADWAMAVQDFVFRAAEGSRPDFPFEPESPALAETAALLKEAEARIGERPAVVCLLAHPPVDGDLLYLNLELFRHALRGVRRIRGYPCRPRLLNAVDVYALDMLAMYEEGIYTGFMSTAHLGFDRIPGQRKGPGRWIFSGKVWSSTVWRILRTLHRSRDFLMVPGGGVPVTARLFYCTRELAGRLCRESAAQGRRAADVRKALLDASPAFRQFLDSAAIGDGLKKNLWRCIEAWLVSLQTDKEAFLQARGGQPALAVENALEELCLALGRSDAKAVREDFRREFRRETPYRERFFEMLAGRVVGRGTPVVLLPLGFGSPEDVRIGFGKPLALLSAEGRRAARTIEVLEAGAEPRKRPLRDFCREFITSSFR